MPAESSTSAFKEWFNAERHRAIAALVAKVEPRFDRARFLSLTIDGLESRSLMQRMRQTSLALHAAIPGNYPRQLAVLRALAPELQHNFVGIVLPDFVAQFGLESPALSLPALREFTRFGSSEFGIRPFIARDQAGTLATMSTWARDPDEHVRRLASEGCRPRLPWGQRLASLVANPEPLAPILDALRDDPALYVRKSVANNLNDIAKNHPAWVLDRLEAWGMASPRTAWIARRAVRTLIKKGNPRALKLLGIGAMPRVKVVLRVSPARLKLGEKIAIVADVTSTSASAQHLALDYVVHYVRASDRASAKVFKWTEFDLARGESRTFTKRQTIRDFTTRRHHAGTHRIELQLNGRRLAEASFELRVPRARWSAAFPKRPLAPR